MKETDRLAEVGKEGEKTKLHYVRELAHAPENVWTALTESEHLRAWMPVDLLGERVPGAAWTARFWPDFVFKYAIKEADLPAQLRIWNPPRTLEWRWDSDLLLFELEPTASGTQLRFSTWIDTTDVPGHKTAAGYHLCLECLEEHLERGTVQVPLLEREPGELEGRYAALFEATLHGSGARLD